MNVYHLDCIDGFKTIENNTIDCCIADPPYGISFQSSRRTEKSKRKPKIANDEVPYTDWIIPLYEKMKEGGRLICFYRWDVQDEFLGSIEDAGFVVKSQIVWDKVSHGMGDLDGEFAPQHELMMYATKGRYIFKNNRPKSIYRCLRVMPEKLVHPNEKPVALIRALIRDITEENELIVDPFGGSFSTAIACHHEQRMCISFEKDEYYYKIGKKNLDSSIITKELF